MHIFYNKILNLNLLYKLGIGTDPVVYLGIGTDPVVYLGICTDAVFLGIGTKTVSKSTMGENIIGAKIRTNFIEK